MTRIINIEIECCKECPYNYYIEYDDVGVSFGYDWYCKKLGEYQKSMHENQINDGIREECPLPIN